ncbi:ABC transporter substrate-binding protein [Cohnella cholangitidis]|uniref:Extracellular solute-binding protein n=1 Tax=Cohnella cholangitidis TaxID=2598458 RepID=A0A7G5BZU8_9BACL|nr:extracellular solute-binding protein [Cohnella cholangitidis]QMV42482.1 extracellular solute-binding protein [Cohnella cholangitidis]
MFRTIGFAGSVLLLASCGNPSGSGQSEIANPITILYLTASNEDQGSSKIIGELASEYQRQHPHVNYRFESVRDSDLSEKIQLLAASNDLPALFGYQSGKPLLDIIQSGAALDLERTFQQLGIYDKLNPAAVELLKKYVDNTGLYALPLEMNIEGFWYNKEIFSRLNLTEPKTWDEMTAAAEAIKQAGLQPFAVSGKAKWPITRLINGYVIRKLGADAMERVDRGELDITDPGFIEAADAVQKMGLNGYFGPDVNAVDIGDSFDLFVQGKAAMFYSGSWSIRDFNDPSLNPIGPDNTGFFSIPLVKGGVGSLDDYPVNAGLTTSFSQEAYNEEVGRWMKFVFERYGDRAMGELGMITGFKVEEVPEEVPPLTRMVQGKLDRVKNGALWFEARFNTRTQLLAWENAQLLVTDPSFTPTEYMGQLKRAISSQ